MTASRGLSSLPSTTTGIQLRPMLYVVVSQQETEPTPTTPHPAAPTAARKKPRQRRRFPIPWEERVCPVCERRFRVRPGTEKVCCSKSCAVTLSVKKRPESPKATPNGTLPFPAQVQLRTSYRRFLQRQAKRFGVTVDEVLKALHD